MMEVWGFFIAEICYAKRIPYSPSQKVGRCTYALYHMALYYILQKNMKMELQYKQIRNADVQYQQLHNEEVQKGCVHM